MSRIFDYFDYRKYLADSYEERRKADQVFSYRFIGMKVGVDPGYLVKVFQGQKHLTAEALGRFADLLKLGRREREYLDLMLLFAKARGDREIRDYFEKLLAYVDLGSRTIDADAYEFYTAWYHTAVREVIGFNGFSGDHAELARLVRPPITPAQARKSVDLLLRLGFVTRTDDGSLRLASRFITTGEEWQAIAVREFQRQTIELAGQALADVPRDERDISTVTVSLSADGFRKVKEKLAQCRREILEIAHRETAASRAYHLRGFRVSCG